MPLKSVRRLPVAKSTPNHLKLFRDREPAASCPTVEGLECLPELLAAFQEATGYTLRYAPGPAPKKNSHLLWSTPVTPGEGISGGHLALQQAHAEPPPRRRSADTSGARALAKALGSLIEETLRAQHALWQREAELATNVPLVPAPNEAQHLAVHLEAVLRGGAQAVGCQAAALYLLDESTSHLKLRSCWGLPRDAFARSARPLRGAVADLEALLGHAVVLEDPSLREQWNVPENFPAAVCVPVSTATTLLGTMWVFCNRSRGFDDRQTHILEIVAGRIASDLERQVLLREGLDGAHAKRLLASGEQWQRDQQPMISPHVPGWELAGWTLHDKGLGGGLYDWFCLPDGRITALLGYADGDPVEAALSAAAARSAARCHGFHHPEPDQLLAELNRTLWTGSTGGQHVALTCLLIDPATARVRIATAGPIAAVTAADGAWKIQFQHTPRLGENPEAIFPARDLQLPSGPPMILTTESILRTPTAEGRPFAQTHLPAALNTPIPPTAAPLALELRDHLSSHASSSHPDGALLIVRRAHP